MFKLEHINSYNWDYSSDNTRDLLTSALILNEFYNAEKSIARYGQ